MSTESSHEDVQRSLSTRIDALADEVEYLDLTARQLKLKADDILRQLAPTEADVLFATFSRDPPSYLQSQLQSDQVLGEERDDLVQAGDTWSRRVLSFKRTLRVFIDDYRAEHARQPQDTTALLGSEVDDLASACETLSDRLNELIVAVAKVV